MLLDLRELFLFTAEVEGSLGIILLLLWSQNIRGRALAWWGWAHILRAFSVSIYVKYDSSAHVLLIAAANGLLLCSYGLIWSGARQFEGRDPWALPLCAGAALWLTSYVLSVLFGTTAAPALLSASVIAVFLWLAAYELLRDRSQALLLRWPAVLILFANGAYILLDAPLTGWVSTYHVFSGMSLISSGTLLGAICMTMVLFAMVKERVESHLRVESLTDPLTGLPNRRAFFHEARRLLQTPKANDWPMALLMIDLDGFKAINDRYGHAVGDRVLQTFANTARAHLRSSDIIGRLGGDEFAVLLPAVHRESALGAADRLTSAFAAATVIVNGLPLHLTATVGLSEINDRRRDFAELLDQADQSLYRGKANRGLRPRLRLASTA
jgi:diguanylate cyclase (GGDEF)-like protein